VYAHYSYELSGGEGVEVSEAALHGLVGVEGREGVSVAVGNGG